MNSIQALSDDLNALSAKNEQLEESLAELHLKYDSLGWDKILGWDDTSGLSLEALHQFDEQISDAVTQNPLLKRGCQLRHGYVFGKGIVFKDAKTAAKNVIDDPLNKRALFSVQAYEELNLAKFTAGNVFTIYDEQTKRYTRVPMRQITGVVTSEDSAEEILYLQRTWSSNGKEYKFWYALNTTQKPQKSITSGSERVPVAQRKVMYHETSNKQVGFTFGIPDGLAAYAWSMSYSHYLKNNSILVEAYSQFALKVTKKTKAGVDNAAAKIAVPGVGGTAAMIEGNELTAMPATGSQVNFNNGQPLAAMVAASLGVSVIALLSSPGAAGGSYGAAATLDAPTLIGMEAIQDTWALFYGTILSDLGSKNASAEFPAIETDPVYRQIGAAAQALAVGGLTQKEFRDLCQNLFDIQEPEKTLPGPAWYNSGAALVAAEANAAQDEIDAAADPIARQGNSGAVGSITQGDTNNDE